MAKKDHKDASKKSSTKDVPKAERKRRRPRVPHPKGSINWRSWEPWAVITVIIAIIVVVVSLVVTTTNQSRLSSPEAQIDPSRFSEDSYGLARRTNDGLSIGDVNAPVVLIDYSDLRCPYCARWMNDVEPILVKNYVKKGKLRIEFRNAVLFGQQSQLGARAVQAAAEQGKGYELAQAIFATMPEKGHGPITVPMLKKLANKVGIKNIPLFLQRAQSTRYDTAIAASKQEALSLGLSAVPAFIINGYPVAGAQSTQTFVDVVESALMAVPSK